MVAGAEAQAMCRNLPCLQGAGAQVICELPTLQSSEDQVRCLRVRTSMYSSGLPKLCIVTAPLAELCFVQAFIHASSMNKFSH